MAFCTKCGSEISAVNKFCPKCGAPIRKVAIPAAQEQVYNYVAPVRTAPQPNESAILWSVINIITILGTIPGILALLFTLNSGKATNPKSEANLLKAARIANITGTVYASMAVIFLLLFAIMSSYPSV